MRSKRTQVAVAVNVDLGGDDYDDSKTGRTPTKKVRLNVVDDTDRAAIAVRVVTAPDASKGVVTPATREARQLMVGGNGEHQQLPRRVLFPQGGHVPTAMITPEPVTEKKAESSAKRKLMFGRLVNEVRVRDNVREVYKIVKRLTGSIGGNAAGGPIYGELTMGSMQKMINLMKEHTGLDSTSRFIDVGSGIGKPSLHVCQDPGVEFSYGIEVEVDRWLLGISCLKGILDAAAAQPLNVPEEARIGHRCLFEHGDIRSAKTFDPFSHVYMFSIGFPPALWLDLAKMWNRSSAQYLICFHASRDIIRSYEFNVELIAQTPTSMHGSKEGHAAYIYRRSGPTKSSDPNTCDPKFASSWRDVKQGLSSLRSQVELMVSEKTNSGPSTRASRRSTGELGSCRCV